MSSSRGMDDDVSGRVARSSVERSGMQFSSGADVPEWIYRDLIAIMERIKLGRVGLPTQ